jgi:lysophospholipase L1-like esterase
MPPPALDSMAQYDSAEADAGPPAIRYVGRFDTSNPSKPTAEWSGSSMQARFSGGSVSVRLGGSGNYFDVVLDGVVQPMLKTTGASSYSVASGLDAGVHDVLVFQRDEADDGSTQFLGFDFGGGGQLLPPVLARPHRIEMIGDSITAGFCDETTNAQVQFTPATENEYIAYGPLTARALNADIHVVAWQGRGLYRNLGGTTTETVSILWARTIPTDMASHWDPSQWVPDAVVINLGTNDYNSGPDPSTAFEATYLQFVTQLRNVYPGAFIFCAVGPMLGGTSYASAKEAINDVISTRQAAGDSRLELVEFQQSTAAQTDPGVGARAIRMWRSTRQWQPSWRPRCEPPSDGNQTPSVAARLECTDRIYPGVEIPIPASTYQVYRRRKPCTQMSRA